MFTDKFIKFPVKEFNIKREELTGKEDRRDTFEKIDPFQISNYRASIDEDFGEEECVSLTLKNGYNCFIYLSLKEFERILNSNA